MNVDKNGVATQVRAREQVDRERSQEGNAVQQGKNVSIGSSGAGMMGEAKGQGSPLATRSLDLWDVGAAVPTARLVPDDSDGRVAASLQETQLSSSRTELEAGLRGFDGKTAQGQVQEQRALEKHFYGDASLQALARAERDTILKEMNDRIREIRSKATRTDPDEERISAIKMDVHNRTGFSYEKLSEESMPLLPKVVYAVWRKAEADLLKTKEAFKENEKSLEALLEHRYYEPESAKLGKEIENARNGMETCRDGMVVEAVAQKDELCQAVDNLGAADASLMDEKGNMDAGIGELNQSIAKAIRRSQGLAAATKELEADVASLRRRAAGFFEDESMAVGAEGLSAEQGRLMEVVEELEETETKLESSWRDIGQHLGSFSFREAWLSLDDYRCQKAEEARLREQVRTRVDNVNFYCRRVTKPPFSGQSTWPETLPMMVRMDSDGKVSLTEDAARWVKEVFPSLGFHRARIAPFYTKAPSGEVEMKIGIIPYPGGKRLLGDEIAQFVRQNNGEEETAS
ncbi:MAG: hypothetical protein OXC07_07085 [Kistimonas sp.]|nr:hypothetical protein [Kistimonas sp.]